MGFIQKYRKPFEDECALFTSICASRGQGFQCANTVGSYECECSIPGFQLTSYNRCDDIGRLYES